MSLPRLQLDLMVGLSPLQREVEKRKACYQECIVRRAYLKRFGWDSAWGQERKEQLDKIDFNSVCEARGYRVPPSRDIDLQGICDKLERYEQLIDSGFDPGMAARLYGDLSVRPVGFDGEKYEGLARLEIARRHPERRRQLFNWDPSSKEPKQRGPDGYWLALIQHSYDHLHLLWDTADFHANDFLRLIYLYGQTPDHIRFRRPAWRLVYELDRDPDFSAAAERKMIEALRAFKYWMDEEPKAEVCDALVQARKTADKEPKDDDAYKYEMTFWSENHQILFPAAEYLIGQWLPNAVFMPGRAFRDGGDDPQRGDYTGAERMARAKPRIMRWLNDRLRFGFSEWNAPGYYKEHLQALFNLADFCLDDEIRMRTHMVMDLLFFDLARFTHKGHFGATAGRAYFEHKNCGWEQGVCDLTEILFGTHDGIFVGFDPSPGMLASSRVYRVPEAIIAIGQDREAAFVDRSRVSINFDEAKAYGIGFEAEEDVLRWWSRAAWFTKDIIDATDRLAEKYKLKSTPPFSESLPKLGGVSTAVGGLKLLGYAALGPLAPLAIPVLGNPFKQKRAAADITSIINEGSALTRANLYTYRDRHVMLSSVQNFRAGQFNFQTHPCQATLSMGAMVWTTHPSAGSYISEGAKTGVNIAGGIGGGLLGGAVGSLPGLVGGAVFGAQLLSGEEEGEHKGEVKLIPAGHNGPNWWTGSVTLPRVVQKGNAAIIAYQPKDFQLALFGQRTHAWFPKSAFDRDADDEDLEGYAPPTRLGPLPTPMPVVDTSLKTAIPSLTPVAAANANVDTGAWIFGRVGDGYVALYSAQKPEWTTSGDWKDYEIVAEGKRNIFILQVGSKDQFGSYINFKRQVLSARIHVNGLHWGPADFQCSYDIPGGERLELHYDENQVRYAGRRFSDDNFPRFENPFIKCGRVLWGQYYYTLQHKGHSLTHDFRALKKDPNGQVYRYLNTRERDCALIETLQVRIVTSGRWGAGTDNDVYFDIGPLAWELDTPDYDDFERGDSDTYDLPLPEDIQLTTRDIVWLRLHKKGIFGVDGTGDGLGGAWRPERIALLVNGDILHQFEINQWLDADNPVWMQTLYPGTAEALFARSLRLLPNEPIGAFDEDVAFITTPLFKEKGISGWWKIPQLPIACVEGTVLRPPARSTDSLATIDLQVAKLEVGGQVFTFDAPGGIAHKRYLRVEYRYRMEPFPWQSGQYYVPRQGERVRICGEVKWDTDREGWYEIHPRGPDEVRPL